MPPPKQSVTFLAGGRWYACDLLWIREILRQPRITPVDRAPKAVRGLIHLRGQILTALDLDKRLGAQSTLDPPKNRCIVFKTASELERLAVQPDDAEHAGPDILGVIVDEIGDILSEDETALPPPPETLSGLDHDCIAGVIARPEGLIIKLNVGALLSVPTAS